MLDINGWEFVLLLVVALMVLGPEGLPTYAAQLAKVVRQAKALSLGMRAQMRESFGPEFDDVDWTRLDPRRYDPRAIVRDALAEPWEDVAHSVRNTKSTPHAGPVEAAPRWADGQDGTRDGDVPE